MTEEECRQFLHDLDERLRRFAELTDRVETAFSKLGDAAQRASQAASEMSDAVIMAQQAARRNA